MSFSAQVKEELCRIRPKAEREQRAQLAGLTRTCASLRLGRRAAQVLYQSESPAVVRHIAQLCGALYRLDAVTMLREQAHRRQPLTVLSLSGPDCRRLLADTGVLGEGDGGDRTGPGTEWLSGHALADQAEALAALGADGVGLYRYDSLFANDLYPTFAAQEAQALRGLAAPRG